MDRRQFMRELGKGVTGAIREVAGPLVERDIGKLMKLADRFSGYVYHTVLLPQSWPRMEQVSGHPFLLNREAGEWKAYSGLCPSCGQYLHYLAHAGSMKCFSCDREFGMGPDTSLVRLPVRQAHDLLQVGLPGGEGV